MGAPARESSRHLAAFEVWIALGDGRSFSEVARRMKVSAGAVAMWAQTFDWKNRLAEHDKAVALITRTAAIEDEAKARILALKVTRAVQARVAVGLSTGALQPTVSDFIAASKHEQLLLGKATERSEVIGGAAFEAALERLAAVIEEVIEDPALRQKLASRLLEVPPPGSVAQAEPSAHA
jgi:hypothetical protein